MAHDVHGRALLWLSPGCHTALRPHGFALSALTPTALLRCRRPKLELPSLELPSLELPAVIAEDATFLAIQEALTYKPMPDSQKPKKLEFDNLGRLKKNPNKGFNGGKKLGTYLD